MTSKPTAYLANMLYVPSSLVKTEHMHAYTYEIESSQSTPQTHLPIICENCQMWGLQWRKPNQGTCASIGYTQNDSCGMFRPKVEKVKITTEVTTWSQEGDYFLFPRGDLGKLDRVFGDIPIHDMRVAPPLGFELSMKPHIVLRPEQQDIVTRWMQCGYGIIQAPTGFGKTTMMCYLFCKLGVRALVLADKVRHLQVVEEGLREHTDIDEVEKELGYAVCGELGTQVKFKPNGSRYVINKPGTVYPITFSTYQSLTSKNGRALLPHLRDYFGVVWHEESHHEAAETFHEVTKSFNPYYRGGQTATPERGDKLHIVMFDTIGPVTAMATTEMMKPRAQFIHTGVQVPDHLFRGQYAMPRVETWLAGSSEYFEHVVESICADLANGRKVLVFSKRKKFNVKLSRALHLRGYEVEVIDGNTKKVKEQSWYAQQLQEGNLNCIIGTQVIQENFNIPPLDCLHLPFTNFTEGLEKQIVGRVLRSNVANKPQPLVRVYTWESTQKLAQMAIHWRRKLYSKLGYDFDQDKNLGPSLSDLLRDFG